MEKLDSKVFDEYLEAYVDAHDKVSEWRDLRMRECRIVAFWAMNNARGGLYVLYIAMGPCSSGLAG